jgi:hypothetical protein
MEPQLLAPPPSSVALRRLLTAAWAAPLLAALACPSLGHQPPAANRPIGTVGDRELTAGDVERMVRKRTQGRPLASDQQRQARALAVRELVDESLLRAEIARRQIVVEPAEINERIAMISKDLAARRSSIDEFRSQIGLDVEDFRAQIEFDLAVPKLVVPLINAEVMQKVTAAHRRDYDGTRMRVSHIILRADAGSGDEPLPVLKARAERIRREILTGEMTFSQAAERHSAGPSWRRGGDIGFVPRHGLLAEEFTSQVFDLAKGELSPPIVTPFGVHLVTVTDIDEGTVTPDRFSTQLSKIAFQEVLADLLRQCQERTPVSLAPGVEIAESRSQSVPPAPPAP